MNKRALDVIIIFSLVGIVAFLAHDALQGSKNSVSVAPIISPAGEKSSPTPHAAVQSAKDAQTTCKHTYFSFAPGTTWNYKLSSRSSVGETNDQDTEYRATLTSTIKRNTGSSIDIETRIRELDGKESVTELRMNCRESGIYGLPALVIPHLADKQNEDLQNSITSNLLETFLLLPSEELDQTSTWTSPLSLNLSIPVDLNSFGLGVENSVTTISDKTVRIESTFTSGDLLEGQDLKIFKDPTLFTYELTRGVGLSEFKIDIDMDTLGSLSSTLTLTSFDTP